MARHKHHKKYKDSYYSGNKIKKFCITASSIIGIGLGSIFVYNNLMKSDLNRARENPSLRQKYLEHLVSKSDIPFSAGVIYDHNGEEMPEYLEYILREHNVPKDQIGDSMESVKQVSNYGNYDAKTPEVLDFSGEGIKPPIFIGRYLFDKDYTEEEIRECIVAHEGRHSEQVCVGLEKLGYLKKENLLRGIKTGSIPYSTVYLIGEIDAVNSELKAIECGKIKVSSKYYEKTLKIYNMGRERISMSVNLLSGDQKTLFENTLKLNPER